MPRRGMHVQVGIVTGGVAAGWSARHAAGGEQLSEIVGGLVGGWLGGLMPDWLEPATSPNHRGLAHSLSGLGLLTAANWGEMQAACRMNAARCDTEALRHSADSQMCRKFRNEALLWRLVAGVLIGFAAGYASHLLLDAGTPKGIPVV